MRDILEDIRAKLSGGVYQNEEHVRLSLVARICRTLGWDVWNPREVNTEFHAVPDEDRSRVDVGLFYPPAHARVFIEVKAVGKLESNLAAVEHQLRDYNRNHTAMFSIITDGRLWYFYYSQTGGAFADKRFESLDLLVDPVEASADALTTFLSKDAILSGKSREKAESYLRLTKKQRAMDQLFPAAHKSVMEPPYPSLPQALKALLEAEGYRASVDEVVRFIHKREAPRPTSRAAPSTVPHPTALSAAARRGTHRAPTPASAMPSRPSLPRALFPPDGTACRFRYKQQMFEGVIQQGRLVVGGAAHKSLSSASGALTGTSRNGWLDWELLLPNSTVWSLADQWRNKHRDR